MSTLTREDGVQFVIQAYRELIKYKKKSLLAERIRKISAQQGQFVRLFKKRSNEYEAVFSAEPGYLFGESVKQYFQQTNNLLFFEAISGNSRQVLLVIIHNGNVFSDTIIDIEQITEEILPLTTLQVSFDAVIAGDIPKLNKDNLTALFDFPKGFISSIEHLQDPLLPRLPNIPIVRLLPLPLALRSERLNGNSVLSPANLLSVVLVILFAVILSHTLRNTTVQQPKSEQPNPLKDFYQVQQSSPAPCELIDAFQHKLQELYQIPGWQIKKVSMQSNTLSAAIISTGGTFQQLETWAAQGHYEVDLRTDGVYLNTSKNIKQRDLIPAPVAVQPVVEKLLDMINRSFLDVTTNLNQIVYHSQSKEIQLTINFVGLAPSELSTLKRILNGLPVVLKSINFTLGPDSLQDGAIELSVWGK